MSAITPKHGGFAGRHNVYMPEDYIHRDEETGAIHLRDGQRAVYASEDLFASLHQGLNDEVGDAANTIMYKCGYTWGVNDMRRFSDRMRHEYGGGKTDMWDMNRKFVLETWWWPLVSQGWGAWSIDFAFEKQGLTFITIKNSVIAKSLEQVGKPVCFMYAGMFAGVFSVFDKKERASIEVQCYSMGNDCCKFLVGDDERVNAAEFWRREGANADEIYGRLGE